MNIIFEILASEVKKEKKKKRKTKQVRSIRMEQEETALLVLIEDKINDIEHP